MFGRINIVYDSHAMALQIPRSAVIEEAGESAVFIVSDDTAQKRIIRTGYSADGNVEVLEGLADDDEIVIVGQMNLKTGSKVSVINSTGAAEMSASNDSTGS
jgi:membrane fusion protein (multidrug efflux system)